MTVLLLTSVWSFGQIDCDTTKYPKLLSNSYQCKWTFFTLADTVNGIILKHEKQNTGCGLFATASLTIIITDNDTIRVLDLCNQNDYSIGQNIKIVPGAAPNFQVHIPSYILISGQKKKKKKMTRQEKEESKKITEKELSIWNSNDFDQKILKTTWGQIVADK